MQHLRMRTAALTAAAILFLAGCGDVAFHPAESSIYINPDGTVVGAEVESFDNSGYSEDRYSADGLQSFIENAVITYNKNAGAEGVAYRKDLSDRKQQLPVSIESLDVGSGKATLILDYASCDDYLSFNEADSTIKDLSVVSAPQAAGEGISLDGLTDAEGKTADTTAAKSDQNYQLLSVCGHTKVVINGDVIGVSAGASIDSEHEVTVSSDQIAYILFR